MRKIQSYDSFEKALKTSKIPAINPDTIITKVHEYSQSHENKGLPYKLIPILISVVILSFGVVVFGDTINNVLFNKKGEKVYEYGISSNKADRNNYDKIAEEAEYQPLIDKLWKDAKPGQLYTLIITDVYKKNKHVYSIQNKDPIYNIDDIKNSTSTKFKVPISSDTSDITFNEGTIRFKSVSQINNYTSYFKIADKKYKEALDKKLDYIIWTEPLVREAENIQLKYTINRYYKGGGDIRAPFILDISREYAIKGDHIFPENATKIKIGDNEGLFIDTCTPEIIYVDTSAEKPLTYHFYFKNSSFKDIIISLIENMQ